MRNLFFLCLFLTFTSSVGGAAQLSETQLELNCTIYSLSNSNQELGKINVQSSRSKTYQFDEKSYVQVAFNGIQSVEILFSENGKISFYQNLFVENVNGLRINGRNSSHAIQCIEKTTIL